MQAAEPRGPDARLRQPDRLRRTPRGRRRGRPGAGRSELIRGARRSSSPAGRSTRRSSSSCPGSATAADLAALGIAVVQDLPGVGEHLQDHLEVYIQYACTQPVSMQPSAIDKWRRPWIGFQWLFFRRGPGATNHFEGGGFARSNDDVAYPNLMFHFLPLAIRYDGSAGAAGPRLPGPHRADVLGRARLGQDRVDRPDASTRRSGSTTCRRTRTGASGSRRSGSPGASSASPRSIRTTAARRRPARRSRPTRRSSTGSPATPRRRSTRRARPGWASTTRRSSIR